MTRDLMCPSGRCREGSLLLGIVGADGAVGLLGSKITVDADFAKRAQEGRSPEKRFRFAEPCLQGGCKQWGKGGCTVIERVMTPIDGPLPACAIRPECRWYAQRGADACRVCPRVVTDGRLALGVVDAAPSVVH